MEQQNGKMGRNIHRARLDYLMSQKQQQISTILQFQVCYLLHCVTVIRRSEDLNESAHTFQQVCLYRVADQFPVDSWRFVHSKQTV